jgi:hypothetical protein
MFKSRRIILANRWTDNTVIILGAVYQVIGIATCNLTRPSRLDSSVSCCVAPHEEFRARIGMFVEAVRAM